MYIVWGPSQIPFSDGYAKPKAATEEYMDYIEKAFVDAVERCKKIGCEFAESYPPSTSPSLNTYPADS